MENLSNSTHQKQNQNGIKQTIQNVSTKNIAYEIIYTGRDGEESFGWYKTLTIARRRLNEIRTLRSIYEDSTRFTIREIEINNENNTEL